MSIVFVSIVQLQCYIKENDLTEVNGDMNVVKKLISFGPDYENVINKS